MHPTKPIVIFVSLALLLAACGISLSSSIGGDVAASAPTKTSLPNNSAGGSSTGNRWPDGLSQEDDQGAVSVVITPRNLNSDSDTIDFDVSLNTHSVDLNMDLATLATLSTDTGLIVSALRWDAPSGGHHVSGVLSFPASVKGSLLLSGATQLTLTIRNLDAAERNFQWIAE